MASVLAGEFGDQTVQAAVDVLASAGVATYAEPGSEAPLEPVAEPSAPVSLLLDQVRAMALEAHVGGGIEGAEMDAMVETEPDLAPPSFIVAGYVAAVDTAGARAARRLMGVEEWTAQDWRRAPLVVFPQLVMILFTADVARERINDAASQPAGLAAVGRPILDIPLSVANEAPVAQAVGPCSAVSNFISGALTTIFNALRLGESSSSGLNILVTIWNFVVSILETVVTTIVRQFEQRVLDAIGRAAAIVGTIATVVSAIRPWAVSIRSVPPTTRKGIAGFRLPDEGQLIAQVDLGGMDEWPRWAADCAERAGRPLPNLKPEGAAVTWQTLIQNPPALVQEGLRREALDSDGAAQLDFTTLIDTVNEPYRTLPGAIYSRVTIERPGMRDLIHMAQNELYGELPSIVVGPLQAFLQPSIDKIVNELTGLVSKHGSGPAVVLFHVDAPTPSPSPTATPTATPTHTPSPRPTQPPEPCSSGCPMSNGDPHIVTIDDHDYDFMAAGEFVLLRNRDGTFELQARQEPLAGSSTVSVNTALAMRVGDSRLGIYADTASDRLTVTADGNPVDATQPVVVAGATVMSTPFGVEVNFSDGTRLIAMGQYQHGIFVTVDPSDELRQSAVGVMGPVPEGGIGVPALPDGTVLPPGFGREDYYQAVYRVFADAWRVTSETSLFEYPPGTSVDTYHLPDFPAPDDLITFDDLTPEQIAAGEAACGHIAIEFLRQQCIYDVAVTGDSGFGNIYDLSVNIVETGSIVPSGQSVRVANVYAADTGPAAIDVYTWSADGAALVATVPYGEASEWFDPGTLPGAIGPDTQITLQRQGEPVSDFGFNLVDLSRESQPGVAKTIVVSNASSDQVNWVGGAPARSSELYEEWPGGFPLMGAPPDGALLFIELSGLVDTHPGVTFFTSAGDGCLTQPDVDGLAQLSGVTGESGGRYYEGPLAVEAGSHQLTLHPGDQQTDPFTFNCDNPPIHGPVPFEIGAGERSHLLLYATPGDPTIRSLILPFGS